MTTYGSLFSGVGGFDLGCDAAGWDCVWQVEYDARCRQVLARHWPEVDRYDDVRTVNGRELAPVDVITYGFPCQDLSVAGKRAGLDGDRSGLFFEAIRIIREMREATCDTFPRVAVAENVVGLLSADGGDAMGRCLDALAEVGAMAVEWRVLDAQWFGVPQRRRRVFLVAVFDPRAASAGAVLPEPEGVRGHLAAQREARETVAGTLGGGSGERGWACDTDRMTFVPAVTGTVTTTWAKGLENTQVEEGLCIPAFVKAKRAQSVDDDETWKPDGPAPTLNAFDNNSETRATVLAPAALGVRRLTPRECERLQGWPEDHTRYTADGTEVPDSARYRMAGNGVAAPVAKYVAGCIQAILGDSNGR